MSESTQVQSSSLIQCGSCQHSNESGVKFCAGCGTNLYEPCVGCSKPVLLTQKFCGSCGADLVGAQKKREDQFIEWMANAVAEAKQHRFDIAISLLDRVRTSTGYRHTELGKSAEAAIDKVRKLRDSTVGAADDLQSQAKAAFESDDLAQAVALLKRVPKNLLSEESQQLYGKCSTFLEQVSALTAEVQSAMKARDWPLLGSLLNQLLSIDPKNSEYQTLATKVAAKIRAGAERTLSSHAYDRASELLDSVPEMARDENYDTLSDRISNARWFSEQFDSEPFATPALGRLALRFAKESPDDPVAQRLPKELAVAVKQSPPPRHGYGLWKQPNSSWLGGDVGFLANPRSIDCGNHPEFRKHRGRFTVAFGLAVQGLGLGRVSESFLTTKKSMLSKLSRKKDESAWGIDIGATGLRAVLLKSEEDKVTVVDVHFVPFDSPLCRTEVTSPDEVIRNALATFIEGNEEKLEAAPVWINLSQSDVVNRFTTLPPMKDKPAAKMLDAETSAAIPLPLDEVSVVRSIANASDNPAEGRPAMVCAARKRVVESRVDNCQAAGLKIAGMQSDGVAIINFMAHEFADELASASSSVAFVDCGAVTTNVMIVGQREHTVWSVDVAGEDLTSLLARSSKTTLSDAEKLKHDPAQIEQPADAFLPLEEKMQATRQRITQAVLRGNAANAEDSPTANVDQTWCVGGGCLCHGWMRRVILTKE